MLTDLYDDRSRDLSSINSSTHSQSDKEKIVHEDGNQQSIKTLNIGDFALVKFAGKRSIVAFVGHVERIEKDEYEMSFLRRRDNSWSFFYPEKEDRSFIDANDVLLKLASPEQTTQRSFELKFNDETLHCIEYKIC